MNFDTISSKATQNNYVLRQTPLFKVKRHIPKMTCPLTLFAKPNMIIYLIQEPPKLKSRSTIQMFHTSC